MDIQKIKLSDMKPLQENIRVHGENQIKHYIRSIKQFGQTKPIILDENYNILVGNGLYKAMTEMGFEYAEGYFKNIDSIILNVRAGETPISVDSISDAGCATELVAVPSGLDGDENYIAAINRFVGIKGVLRFGIRIKCRGRFGICGLNIIYRITGGAK